MFLSARDVSYTYWGRADADTVHAVRHVDVGIPRGSLTGLIGPNGCGKSTLLALLAGVLRPETGTVTLDGGALDTLTRRQVARRIAVVPQDTHPAFEFTVLEIALMGRHPHLGRFAIEGPADVAIALDALRATGTAHLAHRRFQTLSGGEKQRVVIASALAQAPEALLLDEPTASLDLGYQLDVAALLGRLNRERAMTMVMATHDLNLAASICDALVLMRDGRVLAAGRTEDVLTAPMVRLLYDVETDVRQHELAGHLTVVPIGRRS